MSPTGDDLGKTAECSVCSKPIKVVDLFMYEYAWVHTARYEEQGHGARICGVAQP